MVKVKGTNLVAVRELIRKQGSDTEKTLVGMLKDHEKKLFEESLATDWNSMETQMQVYKAAADLLYPKHPIPIRELGRALGHKTYGGVYRIFLRLPKISYVIARAAEMWKTYCDSGEGEVQNVTATGADFVVVDCPDMPKPIRDFVAGNIEAILELTGAKNARITIDEKKPQSWRWKVAWD